MNTTTRLRSILVGVDGSVYSHVAIELAMHEFSKTEWGAFLLPVYENLNSFQARDSAPVAAEQALQEWEYSDLTK
jgi:nucleotide-binding universal stress UspA family protein